MNNSESNGKNNISRKRFLQQVSLGIGAVGAGLFLPGEAKSLAPLRESGRAPKNVLVLGAGLAGLAAAWELNNAGHDVTVLEARSRAGGRVYTLREPFADGLYAEAGGVAFSNTYTHALKFIDQFGLEKKPWGLPELPYLYYLNGKRFTVGPGSQPTWPYDLTAEEQKLGPMGIVKKYIIDTLPPEIANPEQWDQQPLIQLDKLSLAQYLRNNGASEGAVNLVQNTQWFGFMPYKTSALSMAVSDFGLFMGAAPFVLAGGNDQLPVEMAKRLNRNIRYGVEVNAVKETNAGVEVVAKRGNYPVRFTADRVICTIPVQVLRDIRFEPHLPAGKRAAIDGMSCVEYTRTYMQVGRGFWHDEGVSGMASTDLPIGSIARHPADVPSAPDRRSILESTVAGDAAERLAMRSDKEILEMTLEDMQKVHPKIMEHYEGGHVYSWSRDPYALSGPSWPAPGEVTDHLKPLKAPHGRIHFAGEHTTVLRSTMEGALRSGVRAADEVNEA